MCIIFPGGPRRKPKSPKKPSIKIRNSSGSRISISSVPGSIHIATSAPVKSEPKKPSSPPVPAVPHFIQSTPYSAPLANPPAAQQAATAISSPSAPHYFNPYPPTPKIQAQTSREHDRACILKEIAFVKELGAQFAPPPPPPVAPKPTETEKKLLDSIAGINRHLADKERKEELALARHQGVEEGVKASRSAQPRSPPDHNFYCPSVNASPDMMMPFLAALCMARSRDGDSDRDRDRGVGETERRGSLGEVVARLGRIEELARRGMDADLEYGLDRDRERARSGVYCRRS